MTQPVRLERDAFRRGVEDAMTLAPLRDALRAASRIFTSHQDRAADLQEKNPAAKAKNGYVNDGKSSRR